MSWDAYKWARDLHHEPPLGPVAKHVLLMLAAFADEAGRAWPSVDRLAKEGDLSERSVQRALATIVDYGLIGREPRNQQSTVYRFPVVTREQHRHARKMGEVPPGDTDEQRPWERRAAGDSVGDCGTPTPHDLGDCGSDLGDRQSFEGATQSFEGDCGAPDYLLNNNTNHKREQHGDRLFDDVAPPPKSRAKPAKRQPEHFAEWWALYPRKVAKPDAEKAYARAVAGGADERAMYRGLQRFRFADDAQYIPHPATWLNRRQWEDEAPRAPDNSGGVNGAL